MWSWNGCARVALARKRTMPLAATSWMAALRDLRLRIHAVNPLSMSRRAVLQPRAQHNAKANHRQNQTYLLPPPRTIAVVHKSRTLEIAAAERSALPQQPMCQSIVKTIAALLQQSFSTTRMLPRLAAKARLIHAAMVR